MALFDIVADRKSRVWVKMCPAARRRTFENFVPMGAWGFQYFTATQQMRAFSFKYCITAHGRTGVWGPRHAHKRI